MKEPGALERTAWHQDLSYFHVDGEQLCTTWCPLDPVDAETGAVRYARGSHRWDDGLPAEPVREHDADPGNRGRAGTRRRHARRRAEILTFETEPGDVVVHHARTLHAAGGNRSSSTRRRAISVRYCGDDARVLVRAGAPLKAVPARASPTARCSTLPTAPSSGVGAPRTGSVPPVPWRHGRDRSPGLRRRQPLLRGARRVHPPPRPADRASHRAVGGDRRPASTTWSAGRSAGRS